MFLTFSIEGSEETTDARRGKGTYKAVLAAMERLKKRGVPFGASLCYTKYNADVIASDEYADFLISLGVLFAWYFTFVPVGTGSTPELMATAEQREMMYNQIRKWRFKETKPFDQTLPLWGCSKRNSDTLSAPPSYRIYHHYSISQMQKQDVRNFSRSS